MTGNASTSRNWTTNAIHVNIGMNLRGREHERLGVLHGAGAGAVGQLVEEQPFSNRLAGAKRDETNVSSLLSLLDRDRAGNDYRQKLSRRAFFEQDRVGRVFGRSDELGELVERGIGESFQEVRLAESFADRGGHGG